MWSSAIFQAFLFRGFCHNTFWKSRKLSLMKQRAWLLPLYYGFYWQFLAADLAFDKNAFPGRRLHRVRFQITLLIMLVLNMHYFGHAILLENQGGSVREQQGAAAPHAQGCPIAGLMGYDRQWPPWPLGEERKANQGQPRGQWQLGKSQGRGRSKAKPRHQVWWPGPGGWVARHSHGHGHGHSRSYAAVLARAWAPLRLLRQGREALLRHVPALCHAALSQERDAKAHDIRAGLEDRQPTAWGSRGGRGCWGTQAPLTLSSSFLSRKLRNFQTVKASLHHSPTLSLWSEKEITLTSRPP